MRVVVEVLLHDLVEDLLVHGCVFDRNQGFDATIEVSRHPIGRRDENRGIGRRQRVAGAKAYDPSVLEKPPDDALDRDVLGQPGHSRTQAAHTADDQ